MRYLLHKERLYIDAADVVAVVEQWELACRRENWQQGADGFKKFGEFLIKHNKTMRGRFGTLRKEKQSSLFDILRNMR